MNGTNPPQCHRRPADSRGRRRCSWQVRCGWRVCPRCLVRHVVFPELPHTRRWNSTALPAALKGNFFSLDLEEVRGTLERLPWARKVELRRVWPDRPRGNIENTARWPAGARDGRTGQFPLARSSRRRPRQRKWQSLLLLYGPSGDGAGSAQALRGFMSAVSRRWVRKPVQVTLSPRLAWQLRLKTEMVVEMGREQPKSPVAVRLAALHRRLSGDRGRRPVRPLGGGFAISEWFAMRVAGEVKGK